MALAMFLLTEKLARSIGVVGKNEKKQVDGFSLRSTIIPIPVSNSGRHHLAIRASSYNSISGKMGFINIDSGSSIADFNAKIISMQKALDDEKDISTRTIPIFFCGVFIVLSIFHLVLFIYYRKNRSNLYYGLFTFFIGSATVRPCPGCFRRSGAGEWAVCRCHRPWAGH